MSPSRRTYLPNEKCKSCWCWLTMFLGGGCSPKLDIWTFPSTDYLGKFRDKHASVAVLVIWYIGCTVLSRIWEWCHISYFLCYLISEWCHISYFFCYMISEWCPISYFLCYLISEWCHTSYFLCYVISEWSPISYFLCYLISGWCHITSDI